MTFIEIYDRIIPLWGDLIDFSDGSTIDIPETTPTNNDHFRSNTFSRLWDNVEETVGHEDTFDDLMVWTMYQVFHTYAKRLFRQGVFVLNPKAVNKKEMEEQYFTNLNEESWKAELSVYERTVE
ncbi:hypothetical protein [Mucilaginibacter arboris]|uniref:Uncharacterized protein n=1 Tax=Mucilaginibacter arboris TaxID=2682090 RepID=A0A7K1T1V2_9SPHI|nr:hypothetical protein [Mucilaginibacter arboris]MVN23474.1 hypothetical protein [Mucilaginibacter arboris]MVN23529.1 hypothetical protein [Mucilaginibacter arboris]